MKVAIEEAKKAFKINEIPVGAIIVKDNKIIAKAHNLKEKNQNPLHHAEILAIESACSLLNNWRLNDCDIYVTLEPCEMCRSIIKKSRIKNIFYYSKQNDHNTESNPNYKYMENDLFSNKLSNFFKSRR